MTAHEQHTRSRNQDVLDTFAEVARSLARQHGVEPTLQRIVDLAMQTIHGADHASMSLVSARKAVTTVAATDVVPERIDAVQYETGQGPCLDAIFEHDTVKIDDLTMADRWPEFSQRATDLGVVSILAFRMFVDGDITGALNLYGRSQAVFDDESVRLGHAFAAHAALAWDHEQEVAGLESAVQSRTTIGQAQGILMAQRQITADAAFDLLRSASQHRNVKLRDVAQEVVTSGALPSAEGSRG